MKAVFASHTCMGSAFVVGSHHLARELARKGHRVAAVSGISQVTFRCWWCPKGRGKLGEWRLMSGNITKGTGRPPKRSLRHARAYPNRSRDPFLGSEWFDPLEDAVRQRIRGFGAGGVRAGAALGGGRSRYGRQGRAVGYQLRAGEHDHPQGAPFSTRQEMELRNRTIPAYKRVTKRAEMIIAGAYLAGTNTRRVRRALQSLFGARIGKDTVSRPWRKVQADWEAWLKRDLSGEDIVPLILYGTVVKVRLDRQATNICLLVVMGVRRDGQKVLLALRNMGGETEAVWARSSMTWWPVA